MKYNFKGFKASIIGNTSGPAFFKNVWEGTSEEAKVLVGREEFSVENIEFEFHGVELELSGAENLEFIMNIKTLSTIMREEVAEWATFLTSPEATQAEKTEPTDEAKPVTPAHMAPNVATMFSEILTKLKEAKKA